MYCYNCGKKLNDKNICPECQKSYTPISMWGYFGYEILFALPVIGWIILIILALGGTKNINLRNFAKSYFCLLIIFIIFVILAIILNIDILPLN